MKLPKDYPRRLAALCWILSACLFLWFFNHAKTEPFSSGSFFLFSFMVVGGSAAYHFLTELLSTPYSAETAIRWRRLSFWMASLMGVLLLSGGLIVLDKFIWRHNGLLALSALPFGYLGLWFTSSKVAKAFADIRANSDQDANTMTSKTTSTTTAIETETAQITAEQKYKESFGLAEVPDQQKTEKALEHALDIRKFEISLYWQRATYFWALIAAVFAGYFAVLSAEHMKDKEFNAYVLACVGLIFSFAWFLTNRGSKYWQENWENHVDMLEDGITGPLYKTILHRPKAKGFLSQTIEGPAPFSVSQINQWVSLFTIVVWLPLMANVLPEFSLDHPISIKHLSIGILTVAAAVLMAFRTKSNIVKGHKHSMSVKRTAVIDE